jgi:pyruvate/2-oxoglutarate dehydrogenase complex dihydrolipoamide acyltransferase (E2) component
VSSEVNGAGLFQMQRRLARRGARVSNTALLVYVLRHAARVHPGISVGSGGEGFSATPEVPICLAIGVGDAVQLSAVPQAEEKGLVSLEGQVREAIRRAVAGQCSPEDLPAVTFVLVDQTGDDVGQAISPDLHRRASTLLIRHAKREMLPGAQMDTSTERLRLRLTVDEQLMDQGVATRLIQVLADLIEHPCLLLV